MDRRKKRREGKIKEDICKQMEEKEGEKKVGGKVGED